MQSHPPAENGVLPKAIFLMGPTASGKTWVATQLVAQYPLEIISVDSALVYRHMNIGTAKPDAATLAAAPHHLIDLIDPIESYSAAQFRQDALRVMQDIHGRGKIPLLVGGTMLYFKSLLEGLHNLPEADPAVREAIAARARELGWPALHAELSGIDPQAGARIQPTDAQRISRALEVYEVSGEPISSFFQPRARDALPYRVLSLALEPGDRAGLHSRIAERFSAMLAQGLIEEVEELHARFGLNPQLPSMRCVGYRQVWQYLEGAFDKEELRARGVFATRQLAKRQLTWLRANPDKQVLDCLDPALAEHTAAAVESFLAQP